ncbi:MAG: sugar phosphate isomerase/epimerase family protein [Planctomycetota bacterium]
MKYAICNEMFENRPFDDAFAIAKRLGYDGIEIAPFTIRPDATLITDDDISSVRSVATNNGLAIIGLHWLLAKTEGLYLNHPLPSVRARTAAYLTVLARLCARLGGTVLVLGSPQQRNIHPDQTLQTAVEQTAHVIGPCLDTCALYGITLALEPLSCNETNLFSSAFEAVEFIRMVNHPALKLHLDVKAMASEKMPIPEIITGCADDLVHFHANDPNLLGPGMGDVDYAPIADALKAIGYNGYLSVEVLDFTPGADVIAEKSIAYLRRYFG